MRETQREENSLGRTKRDTIVLAEVGSLVDKEEPVEGRSCLFLERNGRIIILSHLI